MKIPIKNNSLESLFRNKVNEKEISRDRRSERGIIDTSLIFAGAMIGIGAGLYYGFDAGHYSRDFSYYSNSMRNLSYFYGLPIFMGAVGGAMTTNLPINPKIKAIIFGSAIIALEAASTAAGYGIGYLLR